METIDDDDDDDDDDDENMFLLKKTGSQRACSMRCEELELLKVVSLPLPWLGDHFVSLTKYQHIWPHNIATNITAHIVS